MFFKDRYLKFKEGSAATKSRIISLLIVRAVALGVLIYFLIDMILEATKTNYSHYVTVMLQALLLFGLTFLPYLLERIWKFEIPFLIVLIFLFMCLGAVLFGEIADFYIKYGWWDDLLHTFAGVYIASIGFFVISLLNERSDVPLKLSPGFVQLFAFILALASECVWEVFEYSVDSLFGTNMQRAYESVGFVENGAVDNISSPLFNALVGRSAVNDTMGDIIEVLVGAFVACMIGYVALKRNIKLRALVMIKNRIKKDNKEQKTSSDVEEKSIQSSDINEKINTEDISLSSNENDKVEER